MCCGEEIWIEGFIESPLWAETHDEAKGINRQQTGVKMTTWASAFGVAAEIQIANISCWPDMTALQLGQ